MTLHHLPSSQHLYLHELPYSSRFTCVCRKLCRYSHTLYMKWTKTRGNHEPTQTIRRCCSRCVANMTKHTTVLWVFLRYWSTWNCSSHSTLRNGRILKLENDLLVSPFVCSDFASCDHFQNQNVCVSVRWRQQQSLLDVLQTCNCGSTPKRNTTDLPRYL